MCGHVRRTALVFGHAGAGDLMHHKLQCVCALFRDGCSKCLTLTAQTRFCPERGLKTRRVLLKTTVILQTIPTRLGGLLHSCGWTEEKWTETFLWPLSRRSRRGLSLIIISICCQKWGTKQNFKSQPRRWWSFTFQFANKSVTFLIETV